jgi:hypothetical protein
MLRRSLSWSLPALVLCATACAGDSSTGGGLGTMSPDAVGDTTTFIDTTTSDAATGVDTVAEDALEDSASDVSKGKPDLPPVFIDCLVSGELSCGDSLEGVSNGGDGSNQLLGWYACQPEVKAQYAASPERVFTFKAPKDVRVTAKETSGTSVDLFVIKDAGQGCAVSAASCVAGHSDSVSWNANEGDSYYLVFDSNEGTEVNFDVALDCCEPSCGGRVCGSDGCGGSCGDCPEEQVCDGGQCASGDSLSCLPNVSVSCGDSLKGETFLSPDTTASVTAVSCSLDTLPGPERAYNLSVADGGLVSVSVTSNTGQVAGVYLLDAAEAACDTKACLTGGPSKAGYMSPPGASYTLLIEGVEGASGNYDLEVGCCTPSCDGKECGNDGCGGSCGACAADTVCVEAACVLPPNPVCKVADTLTCGGELSVTVSAEMGTNVVFSSPCIDADLSGAEVAFSFIPKTTSTVLFETETDAFVEGVSLVLLEDAGDGCMASSCVAGGMGLLEVEVQAQTQYFLLVDGVGGSEGELSLTASCCVPDCEGKSCGDDGCGGTCGVCDDGMLCSSEQCIDLPSPTCLPAMALECEEVIAAILPTDPSATSSVYGYTCNPFDYSGSELAYTFSAPQDVKVQATLTTKADVGELDLFLIGDEEGTCHSGNCKAWGDSTLSFMAQKGDVNHLVVDGFMGGEGAFELSLSCCYPSCKEQSCGESDGCGGKCGCSQGKVCFDGACQKPSKGNACENPWEVGSLPYTKSASTNGLFNDSMHTAKGCDTLFNVGDGLPDAVYEFVPPKTATYLVSLSGLKPGASPSVLYAVEHCLIEQNACLAYTDEMEGGVGTLSLQLVEGESVFLVVDGAEPGDKGEFTLVVEGPF